jgi:hypothetical protein
MTRAAALLPPAARVYNPAMNKTITLSEPAVSLLRRRLAREWIEVTEGTLPVYRELVDAGLMIPLATFTRGPERAFRQIPDRGRIPPMNTTTLSAEALSLLRRRLAGEWVGVSEETRPLYRELMAAGLMYPVSTLINGSEGYYRPTDLACEWREDFTASSPSTRLPSPAGSPSPGG